MDEQEQTSQDQSIFKFLSSTIGKKWIMATTGLGLAGFLIVHLLGNTLLITDPNGFNLYAHKLTSTPFIFVAEAMLVFIFLLHLYCAFTLTLRNKKARPIAYQYKVKTGEGANFLSRSMPYTGTMLLIFIISHLLHFKFGPYYTAVIEHQEVRDLYRTVLGYFSNLWNTLWYLLAMTLLSFHLFHGIPSAFQTYGARHPHWYKTINVLGKLFAVGISLGFALISGWCYYVAQHQ